MHLRDSAGSDELSGHAAVGQHRQHHKRDDQRCHERANRLHTQLPYSLYFLCLELPKFSTDFALRLSVFASKFIGSYVRP